MASHLGVVILQSEVYDFADEKSKVDSDPDASFWKEKSKCLRRLGVE